MLNLLILKTKHSIEIGFGVPARGFIAERIDNQLTG